MAYCIGQYVLTSAKTGLRYHQVPQTLQLSPAWGDTERYRCGVEVSGGINQEGSIVQVQKQRYGLNFEQAYASDFLVTRSCALPYPTAPNDRCFR